MSTKDREEGYLILVADADADGFHWFSMGVLACKAAVAHYEGWDRVTGAPPHRCYAVGLVCESFVLKGDEKRQLPHDYLLEALAWAEHHRQAGISLTGMDALVRRLELLEQLVFAKKMVSA